MAMSLMRIAAKRALVRIFAKRLNVPSTSNANSFKSNASTVTTQLSRAQECLFAHQFVTQFALRECRLSKEEEKLIVDPTTLNVQQLIPAISIQSPSEEFVVQRAVMFALNQLIPHAFSMKMTSLIVL